MKNENQPEPEFAEPQEAIAPTLQDLALFQDSSETPLEKDNDSDPDQLQTESFSLRIVPIPDPDSLREYNAVVPGFAAEFLGSFLEESKHRRSMELANAKHQRDVDIKSLEPEEQSLHLQDKVITRNQRRADLGLLTGFISVIFFLGVGAALIYIGKSIEGTVLSGLGLGLSTLARAFVDPLKKEDEQENNRVSEKASDEK